MSERGALTALKLALVARLRSTPEEPELAAHLESALRLTGKGNRSLDRDHYVPGHFTASAFVLSPDDEVLLIHHGKLKTWLQPGGHVEPSDADVVGAASREVREETGVSDLVVLDPSFDVDVHTIPAWDEQPAHHHFDVRVLMRAASRFLVAGEGVDAARWFRLEDLAHGIPTGLVTDASVRRVAKRLMMCPPSR